MLTCIGRLGVAEINGLLLRIPMPVTAGDYQVRYNILCEFNALYAKLVKSAPGGKPYHVFDTTEDIYYLETVLRGQGKSPLLRRSSVQSGFFTMAKIMKYVHCSSLA